MWARGGAAALRGGGGDGGAAAALLHAYDEVVGSSADQQASACRVHVHVHVRCMCVCAWSRVQGVIWTDVRTLCSSGCLLLQAHRQLATIYFEAICGFLTFSDGHVYRRRCADRARPRCNPTCKPHQAVTLCTMYSGCTLEYL